MSSKILYNVLELANGLTVSMYNQTKVYFGDYYHVKIRVVCSFTDLPDAQGLLSPDTGDLSSISYVRTLEKMGVPSGDVEQVTSTLLNDFHLNSLPYISSQEFPIKLIRNARGHKRQSGRKYTGTVC